jgi:hypothetical protein
MAVVRALAVVAVVVAVCVVGWLGWSTAVAFAGGDVPLTPFHLHGRNALRGIAWLLTSDPIALGVVATAISVPFAARYERAVPTAANGRLAIGRQLVRTAGLTAHVSSGLRIMVVAAFTLAVGIVGFGWLLWTGVVAFVGGTVPLTDWHLSGVNVGRVVAAAQRPRLRRAFRSRRAHVPHLGAGDQRARVRGRRRRRTGLVVHDLSTRTVAAWTNR